MSMEFPFGVLKKVLDVTNATELYIIVNVTNATELYIKKW